MEEQIRWDVFAAESSSLALVPEHDELGILSSTRPIVEVGEHVWINDEQVVHLSKEWIQQIHTPSSTATASLWENKYHFFDGTERTINWLLLLDALNFCFWSEKDTPRWQIEYQGETLNGYWAEAAALTHAVEEGIPLWDAEYLSTISDEIMAHIFRPLPGTSTIPLFQVRVANAREVGRVLLDSYDGQFARAIEQVEGDAVRLVQLVVQKFPSFNDLAIYRGRTVRFFKRAQICVADMHGAFGGQGWGQFSRLHELTIFADYKLPQVLRSYGVLEYEPELAARIDAQELLPMGSEEEVEIRASTIWACELLRQAMLREGYMMNAMEIDQRLWLLAQNAPDMRPYHRTRTPFY